MVGLVSALWPLLAWPMASLKSELGIHHHNNNPKITSVLLQFDGSWRPVTDPGLLPTAHRLAACAACITVIPNRDYGSVRDAKQTRKEPIAAAAAEFRSMRLIGGKILSSLQLTASSAAVEYEGLLLALEGLEQVLRDLQEVKPCFLDNDDIPEIIDIRIQGDCKTVVEQMSQAARPRKLQDYHRRAVAKLDELPSASSCRIVFEHIPRTQNVLCDRISALLLWDQQQAALDRAVRDLQNMMTKTRITISGDNNVDQSMSQSIIANFVAEHLSLDSLIPHSKRPWIYQCLGDIAAASHDWTSVLSVGEQLQREVEMIWSPCKPLSETVLRSLTWTESFLQTENEKEESTPLRFLDELLLVEALVYRIEALKRLGRAKEAHHLQRKKRFILSKYPSSVTRIEHRLAAGELTLGLPYTTSDNEEALKEKWPSEVLEWLEGIRRPCSQVRQEEEIIWRSYPIEVL